MSAACPGAECETSGSRGTSAARSVISRQTRRVAGWPATQRAAVGGSTQQPTVCARKGSGAGGAVAPMRCCVVTTVSKRRRWPRGKSEDPTDQEADPWEAALADLATRGCRCQPLWRLGSIAPRSSLRRLAAAGLHTLPTRKVGGIFNSTVVSGLSVLSYLKMCAVYPDVCASSRGLGGLARAWQKSSHGLSCVTWHQVVCKYEISYQSHAKFIFLKRIDLDLKAYPFILFFFF